MHPFSKLSVGCSSPQLSLLPAAAPKPQFKVIIYHLFFFFFSFRMLFTSAKKKRGCSWCWFPSHLPDFRKDKSWGERKAHICAEAHLQPALLYSMLWFGCGEEAGLDCTGLWSLLVIGTCAESATSTLIWKADYLLKGSLFICLLPLVLIHREGRGELASENARCD